MAGVAAAVAAARNGASVCLLDKAYGLGGLATLGNVIVWLPLCDGRGRQVIAGLAEELLKLSVADLARDNRPARFIGIPACWQPGGDPEARKRTRYQVEFNPASYLLALEKWLLEAGVKLLYDTRVCAVARRRDRIQHLVVENKSGRSAVACRVVIDATGDADVCALAGEETESLDTNVLAGWYYYLTASGLHLDPMSNRYSPEARKEGAVGPFFRGDDAEQVTAQILGARAMIRQRMAALREKQPEEEAQLVMPNMIPCFRMTRRLVGSFSLGEKNRHEWFDDTIGLTGDWRKDGPVYAIPLRSLLGVRNRNLLAVGRCISADTTVWDVTRAIPGCVATGEAAGTAAALAAKGKGCNLQALPVARLQAQLKRQGAILEPEMAMPAGE